ncbi:Protein bassoon [Takifugu flavidus]|uniref:Protein bassoon n=1 Tax=Takifugu flavidus TaxID=433684 RepID=A0A5C6MNT4_9TELE|nr:Protein bassoon [Takifugu flavidus]
MSGGGLDEPPLPVPHPSPKHQAMGSPRHQATTAQQSPLHKPTSQQGQKPAQAQVQKPPMGTDGSGPFAPTAAKQQADTKTGTPATAPGPAPTTETQRQPKPTEEKIRTEPENQTAKESKPTPKKGEQIIPIKDLKKSRHYDDTKNNSTYELSRSPQSLSDTGYSSDGISSSHSEITGLIQEEEMKLSERGVSGRGSPPSPSEITKLESSMRPLLEKSLSEEKPDRRGRRHRDLDDRGKQRPRSLSIPPDAYDSDEELDDILEEEESGGDWESKRKDVKEDKKDKKKKEKDLDPTEMTDEEFMRRQIMEMSADEEIEEEEEEEEEIEEDEYEEDEGYGYQKPKKSHHKHIISESVKEKRRLQHHSSSFEEETKSSTDIYKGSVEEGEEDVMASQGGLRRFKTIELNNTNSYSRDMELSTENDLSLDREPELEMESLTGSPEERSRGDYSSTLPATSSSYGSGQSPTSISSMEEDSDSSPSRRQRLEEAKQQRKARHRSHGPLLPTIEDSSEEDELREEEELLREQEKMREVEQQRIRSTARKTKRDKEELRAQRRRERSKTPPSNLSPIEDASPTEELRQAAEMEELHRSSASEYSPQSLDSEAEGYESKIYKSGSEYNLPTFMSLYSPVEKSSTTTTTTAPSSTSKPLKSAEEVYEEMMRKAEMLQKQQKQQQQQQHGRQGQYFEEDINGQGYDEYEYEQDQNGYDNESMKTETDIYEEIRQTSQNITKMQLATDEQVEIDIECSYPDKQLLDTGSAFAKLLEQSNALLTPGVIHKEGETEAERLHRQQEQLLQLERERVELEKIRQLRLHEELERERIELKLHREKEQILVHRELQELQNIKEQVLQQQQHEREKQLILQREQLAQQKSQLDQIQSLQNQLQVQLEEQKRHKTVGQPIQLDMNGQPLHPYMDSQVGTRSLPNSSSEMCLRSQEDHMETRSNIRKHSSMTRLDGDGVMFYGSSRRIVDSCVQTDDEDREERYMMRHRTRRRGRSVDCSVQTDDDEDKAVTEQPVRRRRSRFSRHSESTTTGSASAATDTKCDALKMVSSSIGIQTSREMSCQTEVEHLGRVSPAIHVTMPDPNKVEIVHYISGPERTQKGQSLACQTDPEAQSQGVVAPQLSVPTTVSPYSSSTSSGSHQSSSVDLLTQQRQQQNATANAAKFERRRPDPLDINYQPHNHLHNESISSIIRQQQSAPKSPHVLYSPVSPVSPHRLLETSLSSERLNKAHVTPQQKSYTAESPQRHPSMPRPIKSSQRSMSDPKSLSPTADEHTKARLALYQQQALQSQLAALQQSSLLRKVKRTLPSPPPDETTTSAHLQQLYMPSVPSLKPSSRSGLAAKASLLKDLTHELKAVEQESTKLRKQQAELEEEEKEIDAKLRYLELGIHQRKETLVKERERRDIAYLRCMGDTRDYMSDSELNNLRLAAAAASHDANGLLSSRPSTAPLSQFTSDLSTGSQYPPSSSYLSSQYSQSQPTAPLQQTSVPYQSSAFNQPPYPSVSQSQALPQPTPLQSHVPPPGPSYQPQTSYPSHSYPQTQPPYPQTDIGLPAAPQPQPQPGHTGFGPAPPGQPPYPTHSSPYPSAVSSYPSQTTPYPGQPQADILTVHPGRPRQTSLADLEHKMPTNYETISNPTVVVTTTAQDATYSSTAPTYGQYTGSTTMASSYGPYGSAPVSSSYGGYSTMPASTYGQYTSNAASSYAPYTTTIANTYGYTTTTASSYGQYSSTVSNAYGHSVDSPSNYGTAEGMYGAPGLEQNIPRNYMMIDDVSELTAKDGLGTTTGDLMHHGSSGRYPGDIHGHSSTIGSSTRGGTSSSSYGRAPEEEAAMQEELYDHHGRGKSSYRHGPLGGSSSSVSTSLGGGYPYYYDYDYKYGSIWVQKPSSSSRSLLAPAVMSTKRSKHKKLGNMEQKISKFSPIEEARDVETDLAAYSSATGGVYPSSHIRGRQLIEDYGFKRSAYDSPATTHGSRYYGGSVVDEDDRIYYTSTGRSRSTGYGMDKISARDYPGYRSRSYERDDRSYRSGYNRGRQPTRQYSEEESSLSPLGRFRGSGRPSSLGPHPYDNRSSRYYYYGQYGSSHSLPDVQDHIRDLPRTHVYKSDDTYIIDDYHCAVSDSEACMPLSPNDMEIDCDLLSVSKAYHLGQEETDWFEKPRSSSRHYSSSHSSGRSRHGYKHSYPDYDEPLEEDLWPQDEYGHGGRHSSSRDHRHHGSSGRHSSSSRHSDEPRSSRSSKGHPKDPSVRHDPSGRSSSSGRRGDSRSGGYHSSDYSRDPSGHHHGQRSSRQGDPHRSSRSKSQQGIDMQGQMTAYVKQHRVLNLTPICHGGSARITSKAPLGLAAAQPVVRAQQGDQRDQDDRVLQVLSQRWVLGRRPSSNNKPRYQRQGQGSPEPLQERGPSNNSQPRDKAWAWGQTKLNLVKWVQQVDPWGRQGRRVLKEIHHPQ